MKHIYLLYRYILVYIQFAFNSELDYNHFCQGFTFDIEKFYLSSEIVMKFPTSSHFSIGQLGNLDIPAASIAND